MLEVDLHLTKFIDANGLNKLTVEELTVYGELLELPDSELLLLLQGNMVHYIDAYNVLCKKIRDY